jgi:hypothetical protein
MIMITIHQCNKTYYKMITNSKWSLIFESVVAIQIRVHPVGKEPNNTSCV